MESPDAKLSGSQLREWLERLADQFESAWGRGEEPDLAEFLQQVAGPHRRQAAIELVHLDLEWSRKQGRLRELDYYQNRLPELLQEGDSLPAEIIEHFRSLQDGSWRNEAIAESPPSDPFRTVSPAPSPVASAHPGPPGNGQPMPIGRYRVERILGKGGFGCVYLAYDEQLSRHVAVKVPHPHLVSRPEDAQLYLAEARTVAGLDHPHIVPVYDAGSSPECPFFVVSKYVEGANLAARLAQSRLSSLQAAELVATVAEALHYAHKQGLVHRDVKPGNILVASDGKPFVVDFGLALREEDSGKGQRYAGTPAYFSPEQARGEGHRVDGRSDIFSLGIVLYELLVGHRPFRSESQQELLEQISSQEPRPPRQHDESIPKELERICFKALAKRASERYSSAHDLAEDLRHFLATSPQPASDRLSFPVPQTSGKAGMPTPFGGSTPSATPAFDSHALKIIPKGLRSFDAHDADFFLELLPGPRDREGLPDSIRFWKTKIEETDPDSTFSVGLIYGPSGCGKSSLVKAGLLPRLSPDIIPVYVEATASETEARLLSGLRKRCSAISADAGLKETLVSLRRGQGIPPGRKVLIVLDQFEQWLHAKKEEVSTELAQALRQCDGGRVQAIVMVRDDFWMSATRFMRELEIRLLEGQNSAAVDLFDLDHARKVLAAFGRAFGRLPEKPGETSKEQQEFLKQAIQGLSQEGKVICVRLAVFAEMMKGKPWTPAILKEVGGTEGIGGTFLEETFSAATAPPEHRYHQKAARAVLKALLPDSGSNIKGHMRSSADLLAASGYGNRPEDFEDLIRILNTEVRLITPTDPEGKEHADESAPQAHPREKYYQLTHDYLVHSLRNWLTRKQKETRRGRAELLLADRAAVWNARPENRQLPSLRQWLGIRWWTQPKSWSPPQQKMMRQASRYHALRGVIALLILALIGWGGYEGQGMWTARALRDRLLDANTNEVSTIVRGMAPYRRWIDPLLREAYRDAETKQEARKQLHASLALLPVDPNQKQYLYQRLLNAAPHEVAVLRDALAPHKDKLLDKLWAVLEQPPKGQEQQMLRAACALATYDPEDQRWAKFQDQIANDLVEVPAVYLATWVDAMRPVRGRILTPLIAVYRDAKRRETERSLATDILANYAADQPQILADLLMDADDKQFAVLFPILKDHGHRWLAFLQGELDKQLAPDAKEDAKERQANRQTNAAVALLKMDRPERVWPLLNHRPDPRVRSYLIHRFGPLGADARAIVKRLEEEPDLRIRRALILSLGEFGEKEWPLEERKEVTKKMWEIFQTEGDPGMHAAAEWLLRHWKHEQALRRMDKEWAKDKERRTKKLENIQLELSRKKVKAKPQWYVNGEGQTMVVIPGPVTFLMGSPPDEVGRVDTENLHRKRIGRSFAFATKPVTVEQYLRFAKGHGAVVSKVYAPTEDCPVHRVTWYEAAAYCNWLSEQEDILPDQWCYEMNSEGQVTKLKEKHLSLTGYRLPTEAEWEYACRAGAVTNWYYGQTEGLLEQYGWYQRNSGEHSWPVGGKKPNDLGLFDMHGNVWCWCQERPKIYPQGEGKLEDDNEDGVGMNDTEDCVLRGGSFFLPASVVRCASRYWLVPTGRLSDVGFRVGRTIR